MNFIVVVLAALLARGAAGLPVNSTVPVRECRVSYAPKILEFGSPPTGATINYATPSPFSVPPTRAPTPLPSKSPTGVPTVEPTSRPSKVPTRVPTLSPTKKPSKAPSKSPTTPPSKEPTRKPSKAPTRKPTKAPTRTPTKAPSRRPTKAPSRSPTKQPSRSPTRAPTLKPTKTPTKRPTAKPTTKPSKAPTAKPSKAPTRSPTRPPSKAPTLKPVTKSPTKLPTRAPTKKPTTAPTNPPEFCLPNIQRDAISGTIEGTSYPIEIVSKNGGTVDFRVKQTFKDGSISWFATQWVDDKTGATVCTKKDSVSPGVVDYSSGSCTTTYPTILRAKCSKGIAKVAIFVHDGSPPFKTQPLFTVPAMCNPSNDSGNKIALYFSLPCQECAGVAPTTPKALPTKAPSKAPTARPTKTPTKTPTKRPTAKPTKAPSKTPTKAPTKRPTAKPTKQPTKAPTRPPTKRPTRPPTKTPTKNPSKSPTKQPTKRPTVKPTKQPTKPPTKAPTRPPSRPPTNAPTAAPSKSPTNNPTKTPTKAPTVSKACPATLVGQQGTISLPSMPITIVPGTQNGTSVSFQVQQVWKTSSTISWVATRFTNPTTGQTICPKKNEVPSGLVNYANGSPGGSLVVAGSTSSWGYVMTAKCTNNVASVQVYVHDGQYQGQPNINVPSECSPSNDKSKKISYDFTVACLCT